MARFMHSRKLPPVRLIPQAQAGDRAAFDSLVQELRPRLEALIRSRLKAPLVGKVEVEDVFQETALRAFRSIGDFRLQSDDSFFRWLGAIAVNVVFEAASRNERTRTVPLAGELSARTTTSPSKAVRRDERFDRFKEAIKTLSPDYREVLMLVRIEGLPIKEVAERMNRSYRAISHLLLRATRKLREVFGETESLGLPARNIAREEEGDDRK